MKIGDLIQCNAPSVSRILLYDIESFNMLSKHDSSAIGIILEKTVVASTTQQIQYIKILIEGSVGWTVPEVLRTIK